MQCNITVLSVIRHSAAQYNCTTCKFLQVNTTRSFVKHKHVLTIQNYQRDALNIIYSSNITLLYMFRVSSTHLQDTVVHEQHMVPSLSIRVLVSCWYAAIGRINNIKCITLVVLYGQFMMHGQRNINKHVYIHHHEPFNASITQLWKMCFSCITPLSSLPQFSSTDRMPFLSSSILKSYNILQHLQMNHY